MYSEPHRALLVKLLNEAHVAQDIFVEGFEGIITNISANNYLTFANEEIPIEGRGHNRALHVSVKCLDHIVAKVFINNDSSLNVMPKSTLDKLPFNASHLRPSSMVVWAFDDSRHDVRGEIDLPIQIGPYTCQITFQVMDINSAYSCLLGQPWIHSVGVVPSTLRGGRNPCDLSLYYTICGSHRRILGGILPSFGSGKQRLCQVSPSATPLIQCCIDGSSCNVGAWV